MPKAGFETERIADGQTDHSVGHQVDQHGPACFAQAAQCSGADALDAIEDLKDGGDRQQAHADGDGLRVMGVHVDEQLAEWLRTPLPPGP